MDNITQAFQPGALSSVIRHPSSASSEVAQNTGQDFEAMFLTEMLQQMFSDKQSNDLTSDPESEEVYQSMMVEQYGKIIARAGGIGVADYVTRTMLKTQEIPQ